MGAWSAALIAILAFLVLSPVAMLLVGAVTTTNPVMEGYHLADVFIGNFLAVVTNPNVAAALLGVLALLSQQEHRLAARRRSH